MVRSAEGPFWLASALQNGQTRGLVFAGDETLAAIPAIAWACVQPQAPAVIEHQRSGLAWLSPRWVKEISITQESLAGLGPDTDTLTSMLQYLVWRFENISSWTREAIECEIRWVADSLGLKLRDVMPVVFMALSGTRQAISAFDLAVLLGPDRTLARLRSALDTVGGLSKKGLKRLEKSYQQACQSIDTTGDAN